MENTDTLDRAAGTHQNSCRVVEVRNRRVQLGAGSALRVEGEVVQLVVHVDGEVLSELEQLLQRLVDEDDADEGGEGLLREAGDVAD